MPTLQNQLGELSEIVRALRERYEKRASGDPKKTLAQLKNLKSSHEGLEAEREPLQRFVNLSNSMQESLSMLSIWAKQLESSRAELVEHFGAGGARDQQIIDVEKRAATLAERMRAAEVGL